MRVNANAVLRSWTLLVAFGGSYAPDMYNTCTMVEVGLQTLTAITIVIEEECNHPIMRISHIYKT